jgi:transcriptional regulator with XRE-family HTH domain
MSPNAGLGLRIRRAREALEWRQQDLAVAVGVSPNTVSNWETGRRIPRNRIGRLEEVLHISLTPGRPAPAPEQAPFVPADDDEARIWAMDEPEEWRRKLIAWKRQGQARAVS